jgi:uncharacterized protein YuzE
MKPIRLTKHAREQARERDASETEVREAVAIGDRSMKISYDSEIDALHIRFVEDKQECRTVRLNEEVALNIGAGETLVGMEVLDAKVVLGFGKVPVVVLEGLTPSAAPLTVREEPPTYRR